MKKLLFLFVFGIIILSSCKLEILSNESDDVAFRLDRVSLIDKSAMELGKYLEFDLYLERPSIGLTEPDNNEGLLTVDLPLELQPKLMYVNGNMCDRPRFPHRCSILLTDEDLKNTESVFLIETTFEDGTYAEKEITIPYPNGLEKPEIIYPLNAPEQQSSFDLKFKDVGADIYEVSVNLCKPYADDGINPCLEGVKYIYAKTGDNFSVLAINSLSPPLYPPTINLENGIIEISSEFAIVFEESVEYTVKASKEALAYDAITKTNSENYDYKKF